MVQAPVTVSGHPLQYYPKEGEPRFHGDCDFTAVEGVVRLAVMRTIDPGLNRHLDERFTGTFPVLTVETAQGEYVFGARPELDFMISAAVSDGSPLMPGS